MIARVSCLCMGIVYVISSCFVVFLSFHLVLCLIFMLIYDNSFYRLICLSDAFKVINLSFYMLIHEISGPD